MRWWAGGDFKTAWTLGAAPAGEASVPVGPFFAADDAPADEVAWVVPAGVPGAGGLKFHAYTGWFIFWIATMLYWRIR